MVERILLASPGGWDAPSARYRLGALATSARWPVEAVSAGSLPRPDRIDQLLARADCSTALVLQRVLPRPADMRRLRSSFAGVIFDMDDALYATPPSDSFSFAEGFKRAGRLAARGSPRSSRRRRPLIATLRQVDVAVVGNSVLADFARRFSSRVVEIPTTVRPVPQAPARRPIRPVLAWMGLPDNMRHLNKIRRALEELFKDTDFTLRIVSSAPWECTALPVEHILWSEDASRQALLTSTLGLAPLSDDPWTRGKCALRSIQYGAHALPTIASPVGITKQVVLHGTTGFLARSEGDWINYLRSLISDPALVTRMGAGALSHVRARYSDEIAVARWSEVIGSL